MMSIQVVDQVRPVVVDGVPYVEVVVGDQTLRLHHTLARMASEQALNESWKQYDDRARRGFGG